MNTKIERDVIARGVFTSVHDLAKKLMRYIRLYSGRPESGHELLGDPSVQEGSHRLELLEMGIAWAPTRTAVSAIQSRPTAVSSCFGNRRTLVGIPGPEKK